MNSATNNKNNKAKKGQPAGPIDIELNDAMDQQEKDICKKIRNGRKKMGQIEELLAKKKSGDLVPNEEQ